MRKLWLCALFFLFPAAALADDLGEHFTLKVGELEREYYVYVPPQASAKPRPLVVVLHGGAGKPESAMRMSGFSQLAAKENFLVAYPAGVGRIPTWNAGTCCGYAQRNNIDDVGFIRAMVDDIKKRASIDPARVYATGMSNGGMMAYRLACEMSDVFMAVAPVAGALNTQCKPSARVNVVAFNALDDKHVLYQGGPSQEGLRAMVGKDPAPDVSVAQAMQFWLGHNLCRKYPQTEDTPDYTMQNYFCAEGREVKLYTMKSGGHSWPGGEKGYRGADEPVMSTSATKKIWEFFLMHPRQEIF